MWEKSLRTRPSRRLHFSSMDLHTICTLYLKTVFNNRTSHHSLFPLTAGNSWKLQNRSPPDLDLGSGCKWVFFFFFFRLLRCQNKCLMFTIACKKISAMHCRPIQQGLSLVSLVNSAALAFKKWQFSMGLM